MLTLHSDLHHAHNEANMHKRHLRRYRRFYFFGTSLPQNKGGGVGWGRPAARARGNEINTDRRSNALLTCQFPVL